LEVGSFDGPDKKRVYNLSNTIAEDLQTTHSVSTVGCSQSVPSTQILEFEAILNQRVQAQMTHIVADYKQLNVKTTELYQLVMEMMSQMGGTCALSYSPIIPAKTGLLL
jgi:hypothetical protein